MRKRNHVYLPLKRRRVLIKILECYSMEAGIQSVHIEEMFEVQQIHSTLSAPERPDEREMYFPFMWERVKSCALCQGTKAQCRFFPVVVPWRSSHTPSVKTLRGPGIHMSSGTTQLWKHTNSIPGTHLGAFALLLSKNTH